MKESDILFEIGDYWIAKARKGDGYEVWRNGVTHSTRCAVIGWNGEKGLERAKEEAIKRNSESK